METGTESTLGAGVAYDTALPLRVEPLGQPFTPEERKQIEATNIERLRIIAALEEYTPDLSDEDPAVAHELQRLDFKLNVLLALVGQLYARHSPLPDPVPIHLTSRSLTWSTPRPLKVGTDLRLDLYLKPEFPQAVVLLGRVETVAPAENGERVTVILDSLGDSAQDWLNKIIFRHHRRLVAHHRRT